MLANNETGYTHFMNWLQNHSPALYMQYWALIVPAPDAGTPQLSMPKANMAVLKKLEQATGEYLLQMANEPTVFH